LLAGEQVLRLVLCLWPGLLWVDFPHDPGPDLGTARVWDTLGRSPDRDRPAPPSPRRQRAEERAENGLTHRGLLPSRASRSPALRRGRTTSPPGPRSRLACSPPS